MGAFDLDQRRSASTRLLVRDAAREATALNHPHLGTEHLVAALAASDVRIVAARALRELGLRVDSVREGLESRLARLPKRAQRQLPPEGVSYTPAFVRLDGRAEGLMLARGDPELTPEHLLLALLWQGHGLGLDLLRQQGIGTVDVYRKLGDLGVNAGTEVPPEYVPLIWSEHVSVELDEIREVVQRLPKLLPQGETFGFNYKDGRAHVVATEGVDLPHLVDLILTGAAEQGSDT